MKKRFSAVLAGRGSKSSWVFLPIPFDVAAAFGTKGRVPVAGTLNGIAFRNSLLPQGDGTHEMAVNRELREAARAGAGDTVKVVLERDTSERTVDLPPELDAALGKAKKARAAFDAMAYSHRKEYADWVRGAKKEETRIARAQKACEKITQPSAK